LLVTTIDFPDPEKLIANQIRWKTSANTSVLTASATLMWKAWYGRPKADDSFCLPVSTGLSPAVDPALDKFIMEKREQRAKALADQEAHRRYSRI